MEAVTLPILSAKMLTPGGDATSLDASTVTAGEGGVPFFFAALLAQQLGISAEGQLGENGEVIDLEADPDAALLAETDVLIQLPQGAVGLPVAPATNPSAAEIPVDELQASMVPGQALGAARNAANAFHIAEEVAAGRQPIAANSASFAEAGTQVAFSVSSEALAEQVGRPVAATPAPATPPVAGAIAQPVSSPAWGEVLGDRVMWMVGQQQQGAELRLNPPALGPLEIKLSMSDGQATLTFSTQHLPVKEALEAATPRLREMFGESGISLGSVSVNLGSSSPQQGEPQQAGRQTQEWGQAQPESDFTSMLPAAVTSLGRNGMVDFFA
jgi:flagellar hook-length control protein FliK